MTCVVPVVVRLPGPDRGVPLRIPSREKVSGTAADPVEARVSGAHTALSVLELRWVCEIGCIGRDGTAVLPCRTDRSQRSQGQ